MTAELVEAEADEAAKLQERYQELAGELEKLTSLRTLTSSQERRCAEITEELEMLRGRLDALDRRAQVQKILEAARSGTVEDGTDRSGAPTVDHRQERRTAITQRSEVR